MTKLSEAEEKALTAWNVVVDALLNHIQHHRHRVMVATTCPDPELMAAHSKAMCRGAKTLALFVKLYDD